ncbi:MAG TPA: hypothetical protein VMS21_15145, partial [Methylomirabilota bacterium]|nr:hypothetical protein [Methylomirabilota bacterium]
GENQARDRDQACRQEQPTRYLGGKETRSQDRIPGQVGMGKNRIESLVFKSSPVPACGRS